VLVDQAGDSHQQEFQCYELDEHPGTLPAAKGAVGLLTTCPQLDS
jgi:hypothetical protein